MKAGIHRFIILILKEPVSNFGKHSLIKDLDNKLKQTFPAYSLIDYGILPLGYEIDEDE